MRSRVAAVTIGELALVLGISALLLAGIVTVGAALLSERSRDAAAQSFRAVVGAVQSYGRRAGSLSALGLDPAEGAGRVADSGLVPDALVIPRAVPTGSSVVRLTSGHRVWVRRGHSLAETSGVGDVRDDLLSVRSARLAVVAVGDAFLPLRSQSLCLGLALLDLDGLRSVMVRTADFDDPATDSLVLAANNSSLPFPSPGAFVWSQPFTLNLSVLGSDPSLGFVSPLSDLSVSALLPACIAAVEHDSGAMIVFAFGPDPA